MQDQLQSVKSGLAVRGQFCVASGDLHSAEKDLQNLVSILAQRSRLSQSSVFSQRSRLSQSEKLSQSSTLSQSNQTTCDNRPKTEMHTLPDDILIPIFSSCDIETLLALRLTCASFCAVIQAYIRTIAPRSAHITFPSCDLLLTPPENGYTVRWLRDLIPAQLGSITLDKDKLRRHPYVNSGFLYGIPSESGCSEATHWRQRLTNGWRVLRSFHLISERVYSSIDDKRERPSALRKVSGGVRTNRFWKAVSCPYAACTEHDIKQVFSSRHRRDSHSSHDGEKRGSEDHIPEIRRKESLILRKRLAHMKTLSDQDLLDYVYLWRLLLHIFRPYSKPNTIAGDFTQDRSSSASVPRPSWPNIISDIAQGCSWLNWFILHIGTAPFLKQWSLCPSESDPATSNTVRNSIWQAWNARTTHQIEIEREFVSKFEFALRKRCLSSERLKRLEAEISRGRIVNSISLDCIPWSYDQHHRIPRPCSDFPWYTPGQCVWLNSECGVRCKPGASWSHPAVLKRNLVRCSSGSQDQGIDGLTTDSDQSEQGPLGRLPYLVYLGVEDAGTVWPASKGGAPELAF